MTELTKGLVQVYTGSGKGKTTAALGLSLRAAGHGLRVCFIQFMKGDWDSGERKAAARLAPELEILGAVAHELVRLEEVVSLVCAKPPKVELVLTGRDAPPEIVKVADLVTEMTSVKHPFERGEQARRGIEY